MLNDETAPPSRPRLSWRPLRYIGSMLANGYPTFSELFEEAALLGTPHVELFSDLLPTSDQDALRSLRDLLESRCLGVSMITCAPDFTHPDQVHRDRHFRHTLDHAAAAREIGAAGLRVTAGCAYDLVDEEEGLDWAADYLTRLAEECSAFGVKLGLENHYRDRRWQNVGFAFRPELFLKLVDRLRGSSVGYNFDCSNQLVCGEDPAPILEAIAGQVWHVHAADRRRNQFEHTEIGEGDVDFDRLFAILAGAGFKGYVSLEDNSSEGSAGARRGLQFLREKIAIHWPEEGEGPAKANAVNHGGHGEE